MTALATQLEKLPARLAALAAQHKVPGASLAVLRGDEETFETATGLLNRNTGVEATPDSVFQIGSITKVYTSTLVMQLVDEGRVSLDEPVKTYLPEFNLADRAAANSITVRQLLTHTSGMDGDFFIDTGRGDDCVERYLVACNALPQLHPPGELFSYCNAGFVVAGRMVEKLRGSTWDAELYLRLTGRIGADDTHTLPEVAILRRAAAGHIPNPEQPDAEPVTAPLWSLPRSSGPAGATPFATARDLLKLAKLHIDGGRAPDGSRVLSADSVRAMQERQLELPDASLAGGWGLGWMLFDWGGAAVIGHDGGTVGQASFLRIVPERKLAVALLTNGGRAQDLYRELYGELFGELAGLAIPPVPERAPDLKLDLARYEGRYERLSMRIDVTATDDGGLRGVVTNLGPTLGPDLPPIVLHPASERCFVGELATFGRTTAIFLAFDEEGRPGYLHVGGRVNRRVSAP